MIQKTKTRATGWAQLAISTVAIALVWLVMLPAISRIPSVKQRHDWMDAEGIDASAMFYTELDIPATTIAKDRPEQPPAP